MVSQGKQETNICWKCVCVYCMYVYVCVHVCAHPSIIFKMNALKSVLIPQAYDQQSSVPYFQWILLLFQCLFHS